MCVRLICSFSRSVSVCVVVLRVRISHPLRANVRTGAFAGAESINDSDLTSDQSYRRTIRHCPDSPAARDGTADLPLRRICSSDPAAAVLGRCTAHSL